MCSGKTRGRRKKETEEIFDSIMTDNFPQINIRQQDKCLYDIYIYIIPNLKDVKDKENFLKEARRVKKFQLTHK